MKRYKHLTQLEPRRVRHDPQLLTIEQLAELVGTDRKVISQMLQRDGHYLGIVPLQVSPTRVKFPRAAVEAVLRGERRTADTGAA